MRLGRASRVTAFASLAAAVVAAPPAFGQATRKGDGPTSNAAAGRQERAAGVIVKVERVTKGATPGSTIEKEADAGRARPVSLRLTLNLNAVWRDWARDQAKVKDTGPAGKDARAGANSVATDGEPVDRNNSVVIDVGPDTKVETRFRSADDETSKGSKTPEAAPNGGAQKGDRNTARAVRFRTDDLKPGLFVEVDYKHVTAQNPASTVAVIRPIGGPDTPARTGAESGK